MPTIKLTVNGSTHQVEIEEGRVTLLDVLRDKLELTGAKYGCGVGQCGASPFRITVQAPHWPAKPTEARC